MLRGWLREKALAAKHRLAVMLLIVSMQSLFDSLAPHVSMAGHLSGALIGFAATMVLRDRLRPPTPQEPAVKSMNVSLSDTADDRLDSGVPD